MSQIFTERWRSSRNSLEEEQWAAGPSGGVEAHPVLTGGRRRGKVGAGVGTSSTRGGRGFVMVRAMSWSSAAARPRPRDGRGAIPKSGYAAVRLDCFFV